MTCPVCTGRHTTSFKSEGPVGSDGARREPGPEDLRITDARYGQTLPLLRCGDCGFIFADPEATSALEAHYAELDDSAYDETAGQRALQMRALLRAVLGRTGSAETLLDIGASNGLLLREAARVGIDAEGVEPSRHLSKLAVERGLRVHQGTLPHPALEGRAFDLVTLVDVIEHVGQPVELLAQAADHLKASGKMVVVTPDVSSVLARALGERWWHYRIAHVGYFDPKTFALAAERAGLRVTGNWYASWYFPVWYLAERVEQFLPVRRLNARARALPFVRRLYDVTVPLNLYDSRVYLLERAGSR